MVYKADNKRGNKMHKIKPNVGVFILERVEYVNTKKKAARVIVFLTNVNIYF